ncbi:hypothetical protein BVC80_1505g13 [Macleaya cordata]|uniref:Uncharacterized protein n=1 Tax=Macleaya cordata TaxID=56857 RepID=A0A200PM31_MACCD|nr:hypothetical protein BVC80_1505g13 [Macleaya cordata]
MAKEADVTQVVAETRKDGAPKGKRSSKDRSVDSRREASLEARIESLETKVLSLEGRLEKVDDAFLSQEKVMEDLEKSLACTIDVLKADMIQLVRGFKEKSLAAVERLHAQSGPL